MKTQTVSDVVEDKNIPLDEILDIFEGYGYGKEEMQDFLDSDMTDLSDAFPELKKLLNGKKRKPKSEESKNEIVNDFSIDAIKNNFTPPGAKDEDENDPNDKDVENFDENFERVTKDVDKTGMSNEELGKLYEEKKIADEMADFQKSLDDYAAKNKKGRDDIPVTTRR